MGRNLGRETPFGRHTSPGTLSLSPKDGCRPLHSQNLHLGGRVPSEAYVCRDPLESCRWSPVRHSALAGRLGEDLRIGFLDSKKIRRFKPHEIIDHPSEWLHRQRDRKSPSGN